MNNYPSILLSDAVEQVASLTGIGRKTALRLVLHLLRQPNKEVEAFTGAISKLKEEVKYCRVCHTISDQRFVRFASLTHEINIQSVWWRMSKM